MVHYKLTKRQLEGLRIGWENKENEKNSQWKGDNVGYDGIHGWVRRRKQKPVFCEVCGKRKPYDLANISGKYKRDINDFRWLCRSCHMKEDGRLKNLKKGGRKENKIVLKCANCNKDFKVFPSQKLIRKTCSIKCMGELKSKEKRFYGNQYINILNLKNDTKTN